jgi:hypothetical protein
MLDNVESLGAPFIEAYDVSPLLKTAKGILQDQNVDISMYTQLWTKLKDLCKVKKALGRATLLGSGYRIQRVPADLNMACHNPKRMTRRLLRGNRLHRVPANLDTACHDRKEAREPTNLEHPKTAGASTGSQPTEAEPPLSMKRELPRDLSASTPKSEMEVLSQGSKVTSQKPEKKSFSLSKFLIRIL